MSAFPCLLHMSACCKTRRLAQLFMLCVDMGVNVSIFEANSNVLLTAVPTTLE